MICKHIHNLRRIAHGAELNFSYMWMKDRDSEIARVRANQARWDAEKEARECFAAERAASSTDTPVEE
jgi:hypothetical protein